MPYSSPFGSENEEIEQSRPRTRRSVANKAMASNKPDMSSENNQQSHKAAKNAENYESGYDSEPRTTRVCILVQQAQSFIIVWILTEIAILLLYSHVESKRRQNTNHKIFKAVMMKILKTTNRKRLIGPADVRAPVDAQAVPSHFMAARKTTWMTTTKKQCMKTL